MDESQVGICLWPNIELRLTTNRVRDHVFTIEDYCWNKTRLHLHRSSLTDNDAIDQNMSQVANELIKSQTADQSQAQNTSYLIRSEKLQSAERGVPQQFLLLELLFIGLLRYVVVLPFQLIAVLAIFKYYLVKYPYSNRCNTLLD